MKNSYNTIKIAYALWSLLYILETCLSVSVTDPSIDIALKDLSGLIPDQSVPEISGLITDFRWLMLLIVVGTGWQLVLALIKNKAWVFFTFISSCWLSILGSFWILFFPGENHSISSSPILQAAYLLLLFIMLKYAYRLRKDLVEF